jgi:antitoxin (DNA-binding transcriptional repressor) of toxin-antitoxin stability system
MAALIGVGQLRSDTRGYLERVLAGETIEVVRRGSLVARIVSAAGDRAAPTALPDLVAINGADARIGLAALRTRAGRLLDQVAAGQRIWIVWHDKLVARIEPAHDPEETPITRRSINIGTRDTSGRVGLDELRMRAGRYFDRVASGETIEIVRYGKVVAQIVSAGDPTPGTESS